MRSHLVFLNDREMHTATRAVGDAIETSHAREYSADLERLKAKLKIVRGDHDEVSRVIKELPEETVHSLIAEVRAGNKIQATKRAYLLLGRVSLKTAKRVVERLIDEDLSKDPQTPMADFHLHLGDGPSIALPSDLRDAVRKALNVIERYGGPGVSDTYAHKTWVLDQVVRVLTGDSYEEWLRAQKDGEDGPESYEWEEGTPP